MGMVNHRMGPLLEEGVMDMDGFDLQYICRKNMAHLHLEHTMTTGGFEQKALGWRKGIQEYIKFSKAILALQQLALNKAMGQTWQTLLEQAVTWKAMDGAILYKKTLQETLHILKGVECQESQHILSELSPPQRPRMQEEIGNLWQEIEGQRLLLKTENNILPQPRKL